MVKKDIPVIKVFGNNKKYFFYDTYTNNILEITKDQYKEVTILNRIGITSYKKLKKNTPEYRQVLMLINKGMIKSGFIKNIIHPVTYFMDFLLERNVKDITLQVTKDCNFKCRYCQFANDNNISRNHEKKYMSWEVAKKSIDFLYNHSADSPTVEISFYGGEPMLNFELIFKVVEYTNKLFFSKKITYRMTTNGSILNDEMMRFVVQNNFKLAISLDGPEKIQDRHRLFRETGNGTFSTVIKNILKLKNEFEEYFKKNVSFMPVVFDDEDYEIVISYFKKIGVEENKIIKLGADLSGIDYTPGLINLSNIRHSPNKASDIDIIFDKAELSKLFNDKSFIPSHWHHNGPCILGSKRLFIDTDGCFYACEKSIEHKNFSIGSIDDGFDENKIIKYLNIGRLTEENCKSCWAMRFCKICFAQCIDVEKNTISKEVKNRSCEKQRKRALDFLKETCNNYQ